MKTLFRAIEAAESLLALRVAVTFAFQTSHCAAAYFLSPVTHDRSEGRYLLNLGFPEAWEARYRGGDFMNDPLPDLSLAEMGPLQIDAIVRPGDLAAAETEYLASLSALGMADGVGIPCYGPGSRCGFF